MGAKEPSPNSPANSDHETEQRNVIVRRLTLAAILIVGLLGLLALFDAFSTPPEENEPVPYPNVVPVPPKRQIVQPVTPPPEPEKQEPALPEPAPEEDILSAPEMPPAPPPPPVTPDASALPAAETAPPERPATTTRSATPAKKPSQPTSSSPLPQAPGVVAPEFTAPLPPSESPPPPQPAPSAGQPAPQPPAAHPQPAQPRPSPGFVVQAGVFTNFQRAEEIHAKLTLHGIPSTLETRVQVGPFKTQAEAEAASKKMRELGIESVILPPARSRP